MCHVRIMAMAMPKRIRACTQACQRRSESCKMTLFQRDPRAGLFFGGDRVSGQEVRDQNGTSHLLFSATYTGLKTI